MAKKSNVVDIGNLDTVAACNGGYEVELKHPATGDPLGVFWTIRGKDSDVYREIMRDRLDEGLKKDIKARQKGSEIEQETISEIEEKTVELLVLCSISWRQEKPEYIMFNGQELIFNPQNAHKILTERRWIRSQLDSAIHNLANFMTN